MSKWWNCPDHPWFVGVQFHPEFTSTPRDGHPLFTGYIQAARARSRRTPTDQTGSNTMKLCGFEVGLDKPFFLIAGPCVIESKEMAHDTAGRLKEITRPRHSVHLQVLVRQG